MKAFFNKLRMLAGGYGGMLFISVLGLSILIFGGILTNAREAREIRAEIARFERNHEVQEGLQPLLVRIERRQREVNAVQLPVPGERAFPIENIPRLRGRIASMTEAAGLSLLSVHHSLDTRSQEEASLRVEIRALGEALSFRTLLEELFEWGYDFQIEGFSVRSVDTQQEIQIVVQMAVT